MPAKAALFDNKANKIFDFGIHPVNTIKFSPHGQSIFFFLFIYLFSFLFFQSYLKKKLVILLGGFGNLSGDMILYSRANPAHSIKLSARDTTYVEWSPNEHLLLTATLFPRLRVDNGFLFL